MWPDSPCKSTDAKAEIRRFQKEVLRPLGIKSRTRGGHSSNVFCMKRWVVVSKERFVEAAAAAMKWLEEHKHDTQLIHEADLDKLIK